MNVNPQDYIITVAAGTGSIETKSYPGGAVHGLMMMAAFKAPTAAAEYDIQIYDALDYLLYAENDLVGTTSISLEKLCNSSLRIVISGATVDGSYNTRLYLRN